MDNLAEKYSSFSPYNYGINNPVRYIDPDGNGIFDEIVKAATNYVANAVSNFTKHMASYVGDQVNEVRNNTEASFYGEGGVKVSAGANKAKKLVGQGVDINIATAEMVSVSGEIDNSGGNGNLNWVGKNRELTVEHGAGYGAEGANIDVSYSTTVKEGAGIIEDNTSAQVGYGLPGAVVGVKYENSNNYESNTSTHTLRYGVFSGGAYSGETASGWRFSFNVSFGYKVVYNINND